MFDLKYGRNQLVHTDHGAAVRFYIKDRTEP